MHDELGGFVGGDIGEDQVHDNHEHVVWQRCEMENICQVGIVNKDKW